MTETRIPDFLFSVRCLAVRPLKMPRELSPSAELVL